MRQGNREELDIYIPALKAQGIKFKRLGGTRSISKEGLSSKKLFEKVNQSRIGAAFVGEWQKKKEYIPCRAFKNIAAGAIPISNENMTHVFGSDYLYIPDLEELVQFSLGLNFNEISMRSESCKGKLPGYGFDRALERIVLLNS